MITVLVRGGQDERRVVLPGFVRLKEKGVVARDIEPGETRAIGRPNRTTENLRRVVRELLETGGVATSGSWSFDVETARVDMLVDFATFPVWVNDNRHLIARTDDRLFLLDSESGTSEEIFSVAPHQFQSFGISRDNRTIYYAITTTEADIWLASMR